MDLCLLALITCMGSSHLELSVEVLSLNSCFSKMVPESFPQSLSVAQLRELARAIAVKVRAGDNWGSGILVQRQGPVYTVLTNQHVLNAGEPFRIETSDGEVYPARVVSNIRLGDNDLALLEFRSADRDYRVAAWENALTLSTGEPVFAAGYPFTEDALPRFAMTAGQVSIVLKSALVGGYQVGYTNDIQKGMSGGPLLNRRGKVVGINGMHAYPVWGNPYVFKDGSEPPAWLRSRMVRSSWGIPAETFLELAPQFFPLQQWPGSEEHCSRDRWLEHLPTLDFGLGQ